MPSNPWYAGMSLHDCVPLLHHKASFRHFDSCSWLPLMLFSSLSAPRSARDHYQPFWASAAGGLNMRGIHKAPSPKPIFKSLLTFHIGNAQNGLPDLTAFSASSSGSSLERAKLLESSGLTTGTLPFCPFSQSPYCPVLFLLSACHSISFSISVPLDQSVVLTSKRIKPNTPLSPGKPPG